MTAPRFDFGGRVALVTGVGRAGQIGNAVALAFGQAGAKIIACDLNAVGVAERVREFAAQGVDARPCAGDLTQRDIAALAVEMALRHFGRLDVVVNVAGGLTTFGPIGQLSVADFDREVAINLKTTVLVSQAAVEALTRTQGCIINFASIAYYEPQAPMAVYSAAKAAVAGFTQSLALELSDRKIRVNAVAPGMVRTGDNVAAVGETAAFVELRDITDGVLSLASPESATVTGKILPISPAGAGGT
ncbi:MAG TPA: SDR family NAD(P)-dependent oxidoreductase [Gemmatimonadales bacterium]|jgi:NAD(P)-dependent dehydrogenase (short-subunit alcohol dehydrogenase family)|nr:SDR family NAD(P)-dependent oxidoreductase [Gemmatimonadales bacterium]